MTGARRTLAGLQMLVGLNALGGGIYGMAGARGIPVAWLAGTPFRSYLIPSLVLVVLVGGASLTAALAIVRGWPSAALVNAVAAGVLLAWITIQVGLIGYVSWLQPVMFAAGLLLLLVGRRAHLAPLPRRW
ncbi:MAG: hypothetical protein U0Q55_05820 [Vicinamibacterales bacterium]